MELEDASADSLAPTAEVAAFFSEVQTALRTKHGHDTPYTGAITMSARSRYAGVLFTRTDDMRSISGVLRIAHRCDVHTRAQSTVV